MISWSSVSVWRRSSNDHCITIITITSSSSSSSSRRRVTSAVMRPDLGLSRLRITITAATRSRADCRPSCRHDVCTDAYHSREYVNLPTHTGQLTSRLVILPTVKPDCRILPNILDGGCLQCFDAVGWAAGRASGL